MILDFADDDSERLAQGIKPKKLKIPQTLWKTAQRRLMQLDEAEKITDLYIPPSNRLESLSGSLSGFYSIRINDRWRVIFRFDGRDASEVQITDHYKR
jgi:proteic killer suppression protein